MKEPYVKNCTLIPRGNTEEPLFHIEDKLIYPYLDGYTIIPNEEYEELKAQIVGSEGIL